MTHKRITSNSETNAGSTGKGRYYHIRVRPKEEFEFFRVQDVGRKGHTKRVAGRRPGGDWVTQKWLISKEDAHMGYGGKLIADNPNVKKIINSLGSEPKHKVGDEFRAHVKDTRKKTK